MKKIISLFKRNYAGDRLIYDEIVPGAEWVIAGEGIATVKYDGTACMIKDGKLYKRYDCKKGKTPPPDFIPAQDPDEITGHWPGWVPVGDGPDDQWHREAWLEAEYKHPLDGTYELVGPKVQGNPYGLKVHHLMPHGSEQLPLAPRTFNALKEYLAEIEEEGIVWHHPDGRMVKVKRRDFGLSWPRVG